MAQSNDDEVRLYEDSRSPWRGIWTLGLAFVGLATLMRSTDAAMWVVFAGFGALCLGIGVLAITSRQKRVLDVSREGLTFFAGDVCLGGARGASEHQVPWDAVTGFAYELRHIRRGRRHSVYEVLCFTLDPAIERPDGHRGFLQLLVDQDGKHALGEFFTWDPERRKVDLLAMPRGGHAALIRAVWQLAPALAEPVRTRRAGFGGPISHALFDAGLAVAVGIAVVLLVADRGEVYGRMAALVL